jgi:hypothetical protein
LSHLSSVPRVKYTETPISRSAPLTSAGTDTNLLEITGKLLTEMKVPRVVLTGRVPFEN